jgi:hypothetical protein
MAQKFANAARAALSAGIAAGDTTLTLDDGADFPEATVGTGALSSGDWFKIVLQDTSGIEICYVRTHAVATTPNTLSNVMRGQEGTTARAFSAGSVVGLRMTAADIDKLAGIEAGAQVNTVSSVAGKTGAVTLTNTDVGAAPVNTTLTDAAAASTLPATTSTALTALLQTVRDCLKWLLANTLQLSGAQTAAGVKTFSDRSVHAGAYTPSLTPAHSATPTFDCAASNSFEPGVMTSNVTSLTMSNPVAGQTVQIIRKQDSTGGRTHAVPSGAKIDGSINTGANRVSILVMTYYGAGSMWIGNWLQIPA